MNHDQLLNEQKRRQKQRYQEKIKQIQEAQARRACIIRPGNPKLGIAPIIDHQKLARLQQTKAPSPPIQNHPVNNITGPRMHGGLAKPRTISGIPTIPGSERKRPIGVRQMNELRNNFNQ